MVKVRVLGGKRMFWSGGFADIPYKMWDDPPGATIVDRFIDRETGIEYVVATFKNSGDKTYIYYA